MRLRLMLFVFALCALPWRSEADPIAIIRVTAGICGTGQNLSDLSCDAPEPALDAEFTLGIGTGQYYWPFYGAYFGRPDSEFIQVTSITGTLFGQPMMLTDGSFGASWFMDPRGATPGLVTFSANGADSWLFWDGWYRLSTLDGVHGTRFLVNWTAVPVPEPSTLSALGLLSLCIIGRHRRLRVRTRYRSRQSLRAMG